MSKNIKMKINSSGETSIFENVSTVLFNTVDGDMATFKDVDDIVSSSGLELLDRGTLTWSQPTAMNALGIFSDTSSGAGYTVSFNYGIIFLKTDLKFGDATTNGLINGFIIYTPTKCAVGLLGNRLSVTQHQNTFGVTTRGKEGMGNPLNVGSVDYGSNGNGYTAQVNQSYPVRIYEAELPELLAEFFVVETVEAE